MKRKRQRGNLRRGREAPPRRCLHPLSFSFHFILNHIFYYDVKSIEGQFSFDANRVSEKILTLNFGKESVRSPFGVRSGSVRDSFGIRSGSVWVPLALCSDQFRTKISGAKNLKFQKFSICAAIAAAAGAL